VGELVSIVKKMEPIFCMRLEKLVVHLLWFKLPMLPLNLSSIEVFREIENSLCSLIEA